ncbi:MAG: single-stranded DNA-binding protein [Candidatus Nanopelagicaceae bacterium]|nr:single-stranded DNA-binding protein [Candidatus Nanopelagicaceae bacterium]
MVRFRPEQCQRVPGTFSHAESVKVGKEESMAKKLEIEEVEDHSFNNVLLRGRVSGEPSERELPSGDHVVEFRIVVKRDTREGVDTLDIAAWSAKTRRKGLTLKADEWVEISGAVRRRFWKAPTGLASRWQIEASEISRI